MLQAFKMARILCQMNNNFMNYHVGIIGWGVVGKGIQKLLGSDVVTIYDVLSAPQFDKDTLSVCHMVAVCVPTNSKKGEFACDTGNIRDALNRLKYIEFKGIVLIKSAVPPGEIRKLLADYQELRLVVSPEYMGESKYFTPPWKYPDPTDMRGHIWQVFGGLKRDTSVCVDIFKRKMGVDTVFIQTDIMTAALTKYMENCFFATKVTFCNEWYDIAKLYGVDYNELRECWLADPRINRNHTLVFPENRGYGGKCFPKDLRAIIADAIEQGYEPTLMKAVNETNEKIKQEAKDGLSA